MNDPWRLEGRVAIVTGAGRGLGRGCAIALAGAGAKVMLVSRTSEELAEAEAAAGPNAVARVADVSDADQVSEVVSEASSLGDVAVLVCAAGANRPGSARDYPLAHWDELFTINVRATFLACRAFADHLLTHRRGGSIVTFSSQMGSVGYPGRAAYCATKHAVNGLTRALAVEWAPAGIRVNAVAPTFVETPMTAPMFTDVAFRDEVLRRLPTGELAQIDDVANAVRYLACPASRNVTGHILAVDGGWTAW